MIATARGRQRGWSLVEAAIAAALLGLMVVAVVTTARKATEDVDVRQTASDIDRANDALLGYTRAHARMPMPTDAAASPSRPGYVEGWLPVAGLGIEGLSTRTRYVVAQALTLPQPIYLPDPAKLAGGAIEVRTTANGLDFCATLMRREIAGQALPGGMRLSYALQQASSGVNGGPTAPPQIWLGDTASSAVPAGTQLTTRTLGFGELATGLDCFTRFAELSRDVRAAAVAMDLRRLADQELALREVQHDIGNDSRLNNELRMTGWGLGGAKLAVDLAMETVTMFSSPDATVASALNVASLGLVVAGLAELLEVTGRNLVAAPAAIAAENAAIESATHYRDQLQREVARRQQRANQLQDKGLNE
ncbi:MAG: hypothetical protein EOP70_05275 [Variovorax sp.]|jgi:type II secretory pathway pseudopilin PulG|nr:MAG: hypothetical protein EOP70_05275 [Variovorax sp.]